MLSTSAVFGYASRLVLSATLIVLLSARVSAEPYLILYPEETGPYQELFLQIIQGINDTLGAAQVRAMAITGTNGDAVERLQYALSQERPSGAITLGREPTMSFRRLALDIPYVIGALAISPQTFPEATGISLSPDPALLFDTLLQLNPSIKRVYTVYQPARDQWLIDLASVAATERGLQLTATSTRNVNESANVLLSILRSANPERDSLWLPLDDVLVDTRTVLPVVIEESWGRDLTVFSSNLSHVRSGVLFAMYPDNQLLGQQLAELLQAVLSQQRTQPYIEPLQAVNRALNLRIARHLGLQLNRDTRAQFELVLP